MAGHSSVWNTEIELDKVVCRFYANAQCEDGDKCYFPHVSQEGRVLDSACRYFLRNKCHFGKECALDHVNIIYKNGKMVIRIIRQQLNARKRQLESLNVKGKETSLGTVQRVDLVSEPCGIFSKAGGNSMVIEHSSSNTDQRADLVDDSWGVFDKSEGNFKVKEPCSSNAGQHAGLTGEPCGVFHKDLLIGATNVYTPAPSKRCVFERYSMISPTQPTLKGKDQKMYEADLSEIYLQDFSTDQTTLKTPAFENISNCMKKSENAKLSLKHLSQQVMRVRSSDSVQHQMLESIPVESESKDLRSWTTWKTPVQNPSMERSEEERHPTVGSNKSDQKREDRMPFEAKNRSQACGRRSKDPKSSVGGFDPNASTVLYNTRIEPRGDTAEEIALFSRFTFLPVDERSRVPLYMRGATPSNPPRKFASRQAESAKATGQNNVRGNTEEAKGDNGVSKKEKEEKCVYMPSGRRVGKNLSHSPNQNRM